MNVEKLVTADHRKDWRKFAEVMFKLEDADPGYMLLARADLPYATKLRYVLAWCTFYNPGLAAVACQYQGAKFYEYLHSVYPTAKRASERRHFRGKAGLKALADWQKWYPKPEAMIEACYGDHYLKVRNQMKGMTQMGDYFYWKLADIWDTVFGKPVDFTGCEKYMPKVPKQGAEIIFGLESQVGACIAQLSDVTDEITACIQRIPYPIKAGRKLALQEAETVCCVFKQHVVGDYQYGFRSAKAWKRLQGVEGKPAAALREGLLAGGIWTPEDLDGVGRHL
jgi:hypothetical protein